MTMMPLESPTFAQKSFCPSVTKLTHVDPEKRISMFPLKRVSLQSRNALLKAMHISSVLSISTFCSFFICSSYFYRTNLNSASRNIGSLFFR